MKLVKNIVRVLITLAVVAVAALLALAYWREYLRYPWTRDGQVQAYVVGMAARVSGPMVNVPVVDNQTVKQGDLLFEIDQTDYAQDVASAMASLEKSQTVASLLKLEIERRTPLLAQQLISLEDYQILEAKYAEALADIEVARADLSLAELNLSYTQVRSPVDGYITNLVVTTGTYVTKGQPLMAIVDSSQFWVTGYFRETDLKYVKPGSRAEVRFMGYHDEPMEGVVKSIGWGIFRADGSEGENLLPRVEPTVDWVRLAQRFPVRVHLLEPPKDLSLRVGTTASVIILPDDVALPDQATARPNASALDNDASNAASPYPFTLKDGRGDKVVLDAEPTRIVSLAPSTTELLYALGAGDKLVANTKYCVYPEEAAGVENTPGFDTPIVEQLLEFAPDLVLASDITSTSTVERLRRVGLKVIVLPAQGIDGLESDIFVLGAAVNRPAETQQLLGDFSTARAQLTSALKGIPEAQRPRVFLAYGATETYTAGPGTFPDRLIDEAGGRTIVGEMSTPWAQFSLEKIVADNPQVILVTGSPEAPVELADAATLMAYREHPIWGDITAVRDGRIYVIDGTLFNIPGPRLVLALKALAQALHPDAFRAQDGNQEQ